MERFEAYEEITFISSPVEKGGYEFNTAEKDATTVLSLLDTVVAGAKPAPAIASGSAADELLKYKQLLDCGAITEEEFRKKKAELL